MHAGTGGREGTHGKHVTLPPGDRCAPGSVHVHMPMHVWWQGSQYPPLMSGLSCQGTMLITNLSSVLKDETVWKEPSCFYPENFLDAQGRFVKQAAFMPFSAGAF